MVFTPQLLRCLHINIKSPSSHLHAMAKRCVAGMSAALTRQANPAARAAIAVALQRSGSSVLQALHKGSKGATAPLLAELDGSALEVYTQQLMEELVRVAAEEGAGTTTGLAGAHAEEEEVQEVVVPEGAWVVEQLYAVTRMQGAERGQAMHVLQLLAANAAAVATSTPKVWGWVGVGCFYLLSPCVFPLFFLPPPFLGIDACTRQSTPLGTHIP